MNQTDQIDEINQMDQITELPMPGTTRVSSRLTESKEK